MNHPLLWCNRGRKQHCSIWTRRSCSLTRKSSHLLTWTFPRLHRTLPLNTRWKEWTHPATWWALTASYRSGRLRITTRGCRVRVAWWSEDSLKSTRSSIVGCKRKFWALGSWNMTWMSLSSSRWSLSRQENAQPPIASITRQLWRRSLRRRPQRWRSIYEVRNSTTLRPLIHRLGVRACTLSIRTKISFSKSVRTPPSRSSKRGDRRMEAPVKIIQTIARGRSKLQRAWDCSRSISVRITH